MRELIAKSLMDRMQSAQLAELRSFSLEEDHHGCYIEETGEQWRSWVKKWNPAGYIKAYVWPTVKDTWQDPEEVKTRSLIGMAKDFAIAKLSKRIGIKAGQGDFALRVLSCHDQPCHLRAYSEKGEWHYCTACGCGETEDAKVSQAGSGRDEPLVDYEGDWFKLMYGPLKCPLRRPGFSNSGVRA